MHRALDIAGGAERQLLNLAQHLRQRGHDVEIFTNVLLLEECFPELLKGIEVHTPLFRPQKFLSLPRSLREFDLVNFHNFPSNIFVWSIKRANPDLPCVWTCNENWVWFLKVRTNEIHSRDLSVLGKMMWWAPPFIFLAGLEAIGIPLLDEVIVLSEEIQRLISSAYHVNSRVVRSGPDLEYLQALKSSAEDRDEWLLKKGLAGQRVLLTVGRLEPIKRFDHLVQAFAQVCKEYQDVTLAIAGSGPQKEYIASIVKTNGVQDRVKLLGRVSDQDLVNWYQSCDALVFPSWCPWGLVVLEAMYFKRPCVVSKCAAVSEVLTDGVDAVLTDHTVQGMAGGIRRVLNDDKFARQIGREGSRLVESKYNLQNYATQVAKVFSDMLEDS